MNNLTIKKPWENFGDVSFLDYNGLFVKRDETDNRCYYVVSIVNLEDACGGEGYLFNECYIDLSDTWIDRVRVMDCAGHERTTLWDSADMSFVQDVIDYYGALEFGGNDVVIQTEEQAIERLKESGVIE